MYNQYNPYLNRFYGQQQANMPQPMEMPIQQQNTPQMALNRQNILYGKQVDSLEVVKAIDIPLDGSISYFPLANGSAIVTKQLMQDGTSKITIYEPKTQKEDIKFATIEDIDKRLEKENKKRKYEQAVEEKRRKKPNVQTAGSSINYT